MQNNNVAKQANKSGISLDPSIDVAIVLGENKYIVPKENLVGFEELFKKFKESAKVFDVNVGQFGSFPWVDGETSVDDLFDSILKIEHIRDIIDIKSSIDLILEKISLEYHKMLIPNLKEIKKELSIVKNKSILFHIEHLDNQWDVE